MIPHRVFLDLFAGTAPVGRRIAEMGYAVLDLDVANGAAIAATSNPIQPLNAIVTVIAIAALDDWTRIVKIAPKRIKIP